MSTVNGGDSSIKNQTVGLSRYQPTGQRFNRVTVSAGNNKKAHPPTTSAATLAQLATTNGSLNDQLLAAGSQKQDPQDVRGTTDDPEPSKGLDERSEEKLQRICGENIADDKNDIVKQRSTSSSSSSSSSDQKEEYKEAILLRWSDMPRHLQFNPYIYTGYRPVMTIWGCIASLFYVHNETINIMTHGLPVVYILVTVPSLLPWGSQGPLAAFLSWCHLIGAVSPWIGSFVYHLFMNLDRGEAIYKKLLQLDMLGIWISQSFGALPMIAASVHCLPETLWHCCLLTYSVLSFWGLLKAMNAWSPWERRLCFAPPFMMRMLVLTLRYLGISGGSPTALTHLVLQDFVAAAGGAVGALHIPEKWIPGKVDLFLNSHNIMHMMVVMAVYSMHAATLRDLAWMSNPSVCFAEPPTTFSSNHEEL
ncbi:progestin and adipoQ receptor family member 4 [Athalia rosae]|uniref:progestin and adipoQ receptor family member 4 n=1 Tax=Athalia rosae TaxID=37344 RepID=UPI002034986A|nr:progestin and adipoQ receptor family member 4 [Athalia rosae]XP_048512722.1 progestin and adipoQ receptor family member 4 [Athalia rosae]XP_048512723.1 progestin and adipoQ receptor family member 4 [Athalia rosae]XP_048512724.1 progestin and adipoQ receptor family member 4 [Athalia rosae]